LSTLTNAYWICGFVYAVWHTIQILGGGENSRHQLTLRKHPEIAALPVAVVYLLLLIGALVQAAAWPGSIIFLLISSRKRSARLPYRHPMLTTLRKELNGRESEYEMVFAKHNLAGFTTAMHALDLAAVDKDRTYTDLVTGALALTEFMELLTYNRSEYRR